VSSIEVRKVRACVVEMITHRWVAIVVQLMMMVSVQSMQWTSIENRVPSLTVPGPLVVDSVLQPDYVPEKPNSKLVFCRERNGWCPYSERVWLALEVKGVDYDTVLIDNMGYDRPGWYSGQTPQCKFVGGERFQGESISLVEQIDAEYPDGQPLYPEDRANEVKTTIASFKKIFPRYTRPSSRAAFLFQGSGDVLWESEFRKSLEGVEEMLASAHEKWGGPFMCGEQVTAADCCWAPFLERWAAQLPLLHQGLSANDPERYPRLASWYEAMDTLVPCYASRVKGDAASWCKVLQQQGYGNAGATPELLSTIPVERRKGGRARLADNMRFVAHQYYARARPWVADTPQLEAVALMVRNREGIIQDMLRKNGPSFDGDRQVAEQALYLLVQQLLTSLEESEATFANGIPDPQTLECEDEGEDAATKEHLRLALAAASYFVKRVCVPRDMGATTAQSLYDVKRRLEGLVN
jgi:glutathione S-transferase